MKATAFAAAVAALMGALVVSGCGGADAGAGGGSGSTAAQMAPPSVVIKAQSGAAAGTSGTALQATVGSTIVLVSASTAAAGATLTGYHWTPQSGPGGSQAALNNAATATASLVPDVAGTYTLQLQVTDSQGQTAAQSVAILVSVGPPVASLVAKVIFDRRPGRRHVADDRHAERQQLDPGEQRNLCALHARPAGRV